MVKRELALKIAESLLWTPYKWGGDDPSGLDCSGMMVEVLKSVGALPRIAAMGLIGAGDGPLSS